MNKVQIISIVSGKGGVGKTMLSVAVANELSLNKKTLLFDLDFFNRGLTGLFASLATKCPQSQLPPLKELLGVEDMQQAADFGAPWSLVQLKKNLFFVNYGDLDKTKYDRLETLNIEALANHLRAYIEMVAANSGCEVVVLDCHGGPDNTSFAACLIATQSILVSEPDRITLHGTLNFLRTLRRQSAKSSPNIRLVFNKVVPAFSSIFLYRFYDQYLRSEFDGRDLLAIFPLELYLTKEFEKIPFLTSVYPSSQLAAKTRLILFELAQQNNGTRSGATFGMNRFTNAITKYYMGRTPKFLSLNFILEVIAIYTIMLYGGFYLVQQLLGMNEYEVSKRLGLDSGFLTSLLFFGVLWFSVTLVWNWSRDIDVSTIYFLRMRSFALAGLMILLLAALWTFSAGFLGAVIGKNMFPIFKTTTWHDASTLIIILVIIGNGIFFGIYIASGIRAIVSRNYVEGLLRFTLSVLFIAVASYSVILNARGAFFWSSN